MGVRPRRSLVFTLATGERKRLPVGEALFRVDDQESTSTVVFGQEDQYLLGATTLQDLALIPDTANHELIPAPKLLI